MNRRTFVGTVLGAAAMGRPVAAATTDDDQPEPRERSTTLTRGESDVDLEVRTEEDDEHVEYLDEDEEVRFVGALGPTGEDGERRRRYETTSWERWGEMRCLSAAGETAADHVAEKLELDWVGSGLTSRAEDHDRAAVVSVYDPAFGDENAKPPLEFDEIVAATPATVDVTYVLDDRSFEMVVPMFVRLQGPVETDLGEMESEEPGGWSGTDGDTRSEEGDDERANESDAATTDSLTGFGVLAGAAGVAAAVAGVAAAEFRGGH